MSVEIKKQAFGSDASEFIRAAHVVFEGDKAWVPQLELLLKEQLSPKKNPFFEHADGVMLTAHKDGKLAGRLTAQIDREHLRRYDDATGFFGFFDTLDDPEVAHALLRAAEDWLREQGMRRMRGPLSLSINEEVGVLVEGFDTPPMVMMAHSRPYQGALAESYGLTKAMDFFAWRYVVGDVPPRALAAQKQIHELPEVTIRLVDKKNIDQELAAVLEIQDDAWNENWGHVSLTPAEAKAAVETLKLVIDYRLAIMADIDGKPAAMCIALPNLNEAIRDVNGKLLPFGWAKVLYRLKVKGTKTARLMLLGIKKQYRGVKRYGGLSLCLIAEMATRGRAAGYEMGELGWTLETNTPVHLQIRIFRGEQYKRYRVYEKPIAP